MRDGGNGRSADDHADLDFAARWQEGRRSTGRLVRRRRDTVGGAREEPDPEADRVEPIHDREAVKGVLSVLCAAGALVGIAFFLAIYSHLLTTPRRPDGNHSGEVGAEEDSRDVSVPSWRR
jgi:hypothetical protein